MTATIGILGAAGRMGRAIAAAAAERDVTLAGGVDQAGAILGPHADAAALARAADVLVDFSVPQALGGHLSAARTAGTAIVIGTTGLLPEHHALIDETAEVIPGAPGREHRARRHPPRPARAPGRRPARPRLGH
jgi:4-hydroxy-tetrahydrodipicolinate reductase